ncbi:methylmalonyl-CoA mutase family protein [Thermomicrobium sp. 4228-Ro]|uniref:acyl-CoA mutase large subunit family protein n=1 Tax=Thermomicrobium sp. 4228-Ro TaxID=2993937 RepID=UPI00224915B1|nr:methylmalonyl-CoA mutase family protein [Thermomicrobium sp. 4228-Ro]MCX2727274.1 methylmalonyl-CoA mutase family protein [Thermomicrobium sp. 4228-Ro]
MTSTEIRRVVTDSGIEIAPVYRDTGRPPEPDPGEYPYTRGIHATMYRGKKWTIRQYAGYGSAEETNRRFRLLLDRGQTGLSVAFDLPTQLGYDSDHPLARPEVGRVGVAISTLDDMRRLFEGIDLGAVTTSMTINAPAAILLLMYEIVAEEQGVDPRQLRGTIQNDILKEYAARGTYIFPPRPSMRLVVDTFAYCKERLPNWNTISISGYHIREAGATAVQEIAFTLANAIAYVRAATEAGLVVDEFAPRLSFFFGAHNNFFEEIAKFRAARRMWAKIMRERFGARNPRSWMLRFHTQTCGCTLTAQQPLNNIIRVAYQALAAVLGGTQSLHTNAYDEALGLPTEESATIALRTQQILAEETGVADTADPLGGSYFVEALTDEVERRAWELIEAIEGLGGAVTAIERGWIQAQIAESAYQWEAAVERGERIVVGVNRYQDVVPVQVPVHRLDEAAVERQIRRVQEYRAKQDAVRVERALARVEEAARGTENMLPVLREALLAGATLGQICGRLRQVWGEYRPRF